MSTSQAGDYGDFGDLFSPIRRRVSHAESTETPVTVTTGRPEHSHQRHHSHRPWHSPIAGISPGSTEIAKLRDMSLRFLAGPWLPAALAHGWDELELWGAFPAPIEFARRRLDCLGLVPGLILGMGCTLAEIGADAAIVTRKATGAVLRHSRTLPGRRWARPWWLAIAPTKERRDGE